jgi:hypothetical protein
MRMIWRQMLAPTSSPSQVGVRMCIVGCMYVYGWLRAWAPTACLYSLGANI